jgi:hypothetical protein
MDEDLPYLKVRCDGSICCDLPKKHSGFLRTFQTSTTTSITNSNYRLRTPPMTEGKLVSVREI